ncbi:MAG: sigma-70 family RNA polymerase sigma factor [Candidatus Hydrogenedentes bacterium]|nr:sigma-70 family RNA polymerase sigma factor [Candidatus Hydrogenedentota bacterium]
MNEADAVILKQWYAQRDAEAFNTILARYSAMVYATCLRILRNSTQAADVTQECFESLVTATRPPDRHLGSWLHRVATNLSLKHIRADQRRRTREAVFTANQATRVEASWDDIYEYVDQAIAELPERYRVPLVAYYLERRPQSAIAAELGVTQSTIAYRINQGVERIGKALRKRGIIVPATLAALLTANLAQAESFPLPLAASLGKLALSQSAKAVAADSVATTNVGSASLAAITIKKALLAAAIIALALTYLYVPRLEQWMAKRGESPTPAPTVTAPSLPAKAKIPSAGATASVQQPTPQGPSITGTVVDSVGNPVAGASVDVVDWQRYKGWVMPDGSYKTAPGCKFGAISGTDGSFQIVNVKPSRKLRISAEKKGMLSAPGLPTECELTTDGLDVVITLYEPASVEGVVVDSGGRPLADKEVTARYQAKYLPAESARTDKEGRFKIEGLLPGTQGLVAMPEEQYAPGLEDKRVELSPGQTLSGIRLVYAGDDYVLAGRVTNERDEPIKGAHVQISGIYSSTSPYVYTDSDGRYSFVRLPDGKWELWVMHQAYKASGIHLAKAGRKDADLVMKDRERVSIAGKVVDDSTGQPLPEFEIQPVNDSVAMLDPSLYGEFRTIHDKDGRFTLENVLLGPTTIVARASGYGLRCKMINNLEVIKERDFVVDLSRINLNGEASNEPAEENPAEPLVEGMILTQTGAPVPNAYVFVGDIPWIRSSSTYSWDLVKQSFEDTAAARSKDDGTFQAGSLKPETQTISAYDPEMGLGSVTVTPNRPRTTGVRIALSPAGILEGLITADGNPVDHAWVTVFPTESFEDVRGEAFTKMDGAYLVGQLAAGSVHVRAQLPHSGKTLIRQITQEAAVASGQKTLVTFDFPSTKGILEGGISVHGKSARTAHLQLRIVVPAGVEEQTLELDEDSSGRYRFEDLPSGSASLTVTAVVDAVACRQEFQLALKEGETIHKDIELDTVSTENHN